MSCLETIYLRKGDSSDFFYNISVPIEVEEGSTINLIGWKAILQIENYREIFNDITSKEIEIILDKNATKNLSIGEHVAYIKFITNDDKVGTMRPLFIVKITDEVVNNND